MSTEENLLCDAKMSNSMLMLRLPMFEDKAESA